MRRLLIVTALIVTLGPAMTQGHGITKVFACNGMVFRGAWGNTTQPGGGHGSGYTNQCGNPCPGWPNGCVYVQGDGYNNGPNEHLQACDDGTATQCSPANGSQWEVFPNGHELSPGDYYVPGLSDGSGTIDSTFYSTIPF